MSLVIVHAHGANTKTPCAPLCQRSEVYLPQRDLLERKALVKEVQEFRCFHGAEGRLAET